jgi:hypothetical protein
MTDASLSGCNTIANVNSLTEMIKRAAAALAQATTAAEVLDAKAHAMVAYDAAKTAARFAKAKQAHAEIIAACHRAQFDALKIEAQPKLVEHVDCLSEIENH